VARAQKAESLEREKAVSAYKTILRRLLDNRPSGTRNRLAGALGKNRSFISQITSPAYAVPIPARHLDMIFDICHFSEDDKKAFLEFYVLAHPRRLTVVDDRKRKISHTVFLPDLGSAKKNDKLAALISEFADKAVEIIGGGK
jgi:hypothetical protein